jgi:cytoskeletal protein CcmA (bactofilin family)
VAANLHGIERVELKNSATHMREIYKHHIAVEDRRQ